MLRRLATQHVRSLDVPVIIANKYGPLVTSMISSMPAQDTSFPGISTIVEFDGSIIAKLVSAAGIAYGEIHIDQA